MSRERSEEVIRRYLTEVLQERKLEVIKEIAAEDMWDHTQPGPGREGWERHAGGYLESLPDVEIVINHIVGGEDEAVGIWTWRGTPVGEMGSLAPGRELECNCCTILKLRDGLVIDYQLIAVIWTTSEPIERIGLSTMVSPW